MSPITFSERRIRFRAGDLLLILFLALLSLLPLLPGTGGGAGTWIRIRTPRGEWRYRLDRERDIRVQGTGGTMRLRVEKGKVRVTDTDCPRKICRQRGRIGRSGEEIICVPLRVEVLVEGRRGGGDVRCR